MTRFTLPVIFCFLLYWAHGQNQAPVVSNVSLEVDSLTQSVVFTFDLTDVENDALDVQLRISNDEGVTFLVPVDSLEGDFGYPVTVGLQKEITWYYDPAILDPSQTLMGKIIADDRQALDIEAIVAQVDSARLVQDLGWLEGIRHRTANPVHLANIRDSIAQRFDQNGLQVEIQSFDFGAYEAANYLGRLPGLTNEAATYIIDGHFDSVQSSPGADDNGSATIGMLEAMRVLSNYQFSKTLRFIGFDLEEQGLVGSIKYVNEGIHDYESIEGVLNFEMIGYTCDEPNCQSVPLGFNLLFPEAYAALTDLEFRGTFINNVANTTSIELMEAFNEYAAQYVPDLQVVSFAAPGNALLAPDLRRSDHAPFWDVDIPALMLTDGANFRNPNYHTPGDTIGTIDFSFFSKVVKATVATVAELAEPIHAGLGVSEPFSVGNLTASSERESLQFLLKQNYPNPFSPQTHISYLIQQKGKVTIQVFDPNGREVARLVDANQSPGEYQVTWDSHGASGEHLESGLYLVKLTLQTTEGLSKSATKKMLMIDEDHDH